MTQKNDKSSKFPQQLSCRVSVSGAGGRGSDPGRVIPKKYKMIPILGLASERKLNSFLSSSSLRNTPFSGELSAEKYQ